MSAQSAGQSSLAVGDNVQQSTALGSTAVNRLIVTATSRAGDGSPAPGSALSSLQFGSANSVATSAMDVAVSGAGSASSVSITGNTNHASAAINQADNGLNIAAVKTDGVNNETDPEQAGLGALSAAGDHVLANWQVAVGSAVANASTQVLAGGAGRMDGTDVSIAGNSTIADASANRALNAVSVSAVSGTNPNAGLVNGQRSSATVSASATTDAAFAADGVPGPDGIAGSQVALNGNRTTSLARGNVADNQLTLAGTGAPTPSTAGAVAGAVPGVQAAAALLNVQQNSGAISASAAGTAYGIPLNGEDASSSSSSSTLGVTGNSVSAAAYGNAASNATTTTSLGGISGAALVNRQVNSGPVAAEVIGASYRALSGPMTGSSVSLTGNQIAAAAIGNQATNAITATR